MLAHPRSLLSAEQTPNVYFENYKILAAELCRHLQAADGIRAKVFSSPQEEVELLQNFTQQPVEFQKRKFETFLQYYLHCFEMSSRGLSLRDRLESLKCFSYMYGFRFPSEEEIISQMGPNSYVEIYDCSGTQRYRSADWLETTSYSLIALETMDWRHLFFRSESILKQQVELVRALLAEEIRQPIYRPLEIHTVKELKSKTPLCAELESLMYAPVLDQNDQMVGIIHILKVNDLRSIEFKLLENHH